MPEIRFRATDAEASAIDAAARAVRLTRSEYIRERLGLDKPRSVGAPVGNKNNPKGRAAK